MITDFTISGLRIGLDLGIILAIVSLIWEKKKEKRENNTTAVFEEPCIQVPSAIFVSL